MVSVGIVGGTGYTGVELLRLLARHPGVKLQAITSRGNAGTRVDEMFPSLRGFVDIEFTAPDADELGQCDVVFFATPHAAAMNFAPQLLERGTRVIDLSADFRLQDAVEWAEWYGEPHVCPELLPEAVYGLPEMNRDAILSTRLLAVPGCYPTSVQLALKPLLEAGLVKTSGIIADCKSGVSGAGRNAKVGSLFCEAGDNMQAYAVPGHRHLPEIKQQLSVMAGSAVDMIFTPHLTPMSRGILSTIYAPLTEAGKTADLQQVLESAYVDEPFVDVMPAGSHPQTRSVRGANVCRMAVHRPQGGDTIVLLSAIDNLVKGAAGQAVQCFNLMFDQPEVAGLQVVPLLP